MTADPGLCSGEPKVLNPVPFPPFHSLMFSKEFSLLAVPPCLDTTDPLPRSRVIFLPVEVSQKKIQGPVICPSLPDQSCVPKAPFRECPSLPALSLKPLLRPFLPKLQSPHLSTPISR